MDFKNNNGLLEIIMPERITYDTAPEFEKDLFEIVDNNKFDKIVLNADTLEMISSAGLRVILKLGKIHNNFEIINCHPDAYDVFEMTGFSAIMNIKKAFRTIDVSNAKLIGDGFFSRVYKVSNDTIVKVFINNSSLDQIEKELNLAKRAFILGVPTAISFDIVKVGEYYGVVFEMLNAGLLRDIIRDNIDYEGNIKKYAELLKKVNTTVADSDSIPSQLQIAYKKIDFVKDYIDESDYIKFKNLLSTINDGITFLHNDCHIKNIMVSNNELFLIDMETFSKGDPIFELAGIYESYKGFSTYYGDSQGDFFGISVEKTMQLFDDVSIEYFKGLNENDYQENVKKVACLSYITLMYWIKSYSNDQGFFDFCYKNAKELSATISDLKLKY